MHEIGSSSLESTENCPEPPTVTSASVATTIVSPDTASGEVIVSGSSYGASDANDDTLTYSITAGNGDGYFEIALTLVTSRQLGPTYQLAPTP